jgi:hypothetical protein
MIHLIIGRREQGKTTLALYMALKVKQLLAFDPRGLMERPNALRVRTAGALESKGVPALLDDEITECIYTPSEDDIQRAFMRFCNQVKWWVANHPKRPLAVLVDEVSFVNLNEPAFQWVLRCSKREVMQIFLTCHRPADIPTAVRAIADFWCLFQCRQEHDLGVIEERCSKTVVAAVGRLNAREFIMWDDERAQSKRFSDAQAWFVPLQISPGAQTPRPADPLADIAANDLGVFDTGKLPI